jgi:putative sigma-54 modulation protein
MVTKSLACCLRRVMTNDTDNTARIIVQGVHIDLTPSMRNVINEKFSVLLRHNEKIMRINVTLHRDQTRGSKSLFTATGRIELPGPDVIANVKADDAYASLDGLVEKLDEQLRERHERRTDRRRERPDIDIPMSLPKTEPEQR